METDEYGHYARKLTKEEYDRLNAKETISDFQKSKLEIEAKKNWDKFYLRNKTNFFKDRHWTKNEFEELRTGFLDHKTDGGERPILLELGCGVGNFLFPLIEENSDYYIYACDFSPRAIDFVKSRPLFNESKCKAFVADLTNDNFSEQFKEISNGKLVDVISLIYVLSAIHPDKMLTALNNCFKVLKPGGKIIFRDYAIYDMAQIRFNPSNKIDDNFYFRSDLTTSYFFSEAKLEELANASGFKVLENQYVNKETTNKKLELCVSRVFIQAKFEKPSSIES